MEGLRSHQITFTIAPQERDAVSRWLAQVKTFFSTTALQASDMSKIFTPISLTPQTPNPVSSTLNPVASTLPGGMVGTAGGLIGTPFTHSPDMADVLEGITVHYAVQLISVLGHYIEGIRIQAVYFLVALASVFDRKGVDKKKIERVLTGFSGSDERGYQSSVHELFHYIAPPLSTMAVALVAGLECFYTCPDWTVRGICNSALARIVYENERVFLEEDHLAAIWNLFFSINSIPLISKVFPDRVVIIKALGLLAPLYSLADTALTYRIIDTLLRLKDKTALETEAIKGTLRKIFEKLSEKPAVGTPGSTPPTPSTPDTGAGGTVVRSGGGAGTHGSDIMGTGYTLFMNLLNPNDEYAYNLLPWALETYTATLLPNPPQSSKQKKYPVKDFPPLTNFIQSLSNHFRATPALVRYGACVCLHAALTICPTLVADHKELYVFVVAGALDTDYLSAFLYMSMLETIKMPEGVSLKEIIGKLRHAEYDARNYDAVFGDSIKSEDGGKQTRLADVLDLAVKGSPAMPPKQLHKMANSLEYLSKQMKLKQLEMIRLWGSKTEKFDTFLMQTLIPFSGSPDEEIQMATIKVLRSLMPGFKTATPADISFAWSYFHTLMDSKIKPSLLQAVLGLVKEFPLHRLNEAARDELLNTLFRLMFHKDASVRTLVYDLLGNSTEFWKTSGLYNAAMGMLLLAIGDHNVGCAKKVIEHLFQLANTPMRGIVTPLGAVRDALSAGQYTHVLKTYDDLANHLARDRTEYKELIDAATVDANVDEFWEFYLKDVPENQLVRPDDYNFGRNFVHAPFWIALVLVKLGVPPPPVPSNEVVARDVMPTTPAGKRRFLCGFMLCLMPSCGMPDPVMRRCACISALRCCFRGLSAQPGILRGLLDYVSQQMLAHKQWTFQLSALDILRLIVRLKLPGVAPSILIQYLDLALDVAFNTPSSIIKIGALELIETFLLVFPHGIGTKLAEVRDVIRALIVDIDPDVVSAASRIFPLIFRCVSATNGAEFYGYLRNEIATIEKGGLEAAGDPLVSNLTRHETERVVRLSLTAMGTINDSTISYTIIQELLRYLKHPNPGFRCAAIGSILAQVGNLDGVQSTTIMWTVLPMYADPSKAVRIVFSRFLHRTPSQLESLCKALPPHADDSLIMPTTSWEEILVDTANITVNTKNLNDMIHDLDALHTGPDPNLLPLEDDGFHIPTISEKLMAQFKRLAKNIAGVVPAGSTTEVIYYLQDLQKNPQMQGSAMLVLSEFCCVHEACLTEIVDIFSNHLGHEISSETTNLIEACMLGLRNISEYSPAAFKQILSRLTAPAVANEGDLVALFYLSDTIKEVCANKAPELLRKYVPIITSQRNTVKKRLLALYLNVELAMIAGQDEMARVLDAIQIFIDSVDEEDIKIKVYGCLGKMLSQLGPKHTLFRNLINNAKKEVKSKDPAIRIRSLSVFRIFTKYLAPEEAMWFCFLYLADSNRDVRKHAKEIIILEGMIDFAIPGLKVYKPNPNSRRAAVLDSCKLPSIQQLGVTSSANKSEESHARVDDDPYNVRWFSSERRRKITERYGMPESLFERVTLPVTQSVMSLVEERFAAVKKSTPEHLNKVQWLLNLDTITILHECMRKYPAVASELVEATLESVESGLREGPHGDSESPSGSGNLTQSSGQLSGSGGIGTDDDDGVDIEAETHQIDVLSNLLFAHDGIGDRVPGWINRVQAFINACNTGAKVIRESLYADLESSFFFFNEYIDVPIVSDEQYEALEAFKASAQEATLEIVKSGKTDKYSNLEGKKNELNDMVDNKSEQLRRLTIIALHGTSGYGLYHALSTVCPETSLVSAFQFLADMLENEHRGIRIAVVEALVIITKIQLEAGAKATFSAKIQSIIQSLSTRLVAEQATLYRRKADMINLIAQLIPFIKDKALRVKVLQLFVQHWRDPDSEVRVIAIKMVQLLGESGIMEVLECFNDTDGQMTTLDDGLPKIMRELAGLISNAEYGEKEYLQELLKWRFSFAATSPSPPPRTPASS